MDDDPRARLTRAVKARREELGMTQPQLAAAAGVSIGTIQSLEGSRKSWTKPRSMPAIERALGWGPRSADLVMAGQDPILASQEPAATADRDVPEGLPLRVAQELREGELVDADVIDLAESGMRMVVIVRRHGDDDPDAVAEDVQRWLRTQREIRKLSKE